MALLLQKRAILAACKPKPERLAVRVNVTASRRTVLSVPFLLPLLGNASTAFADGESYAKFLGEKSGCVVLGATTSTRNSVGDQCQVITITTRALSNTKHCYIIHMITVDSYLTATSQAVLVDSGGQQRFVNCLSAASHCKAHAYEANKAAMRFLPSSASYATD